MSLRNLAHLGDSVYELFVREYTISKTQNIKKLHKLLANSEKHSTFVKEKPITHEYDSITECMENAS